MRKSTTKKAPVKAPVVVKKEKVVRPRIFWTVDEYISVANEAWTIWLKEVGIPIQQCVERAQKVLPKDRWRSLKGAAVHAVIPYMKKRAAQIGNDIGELRDLRLKVVRVEQDLKDAYEWLEKKEHITTEQVEANIKKMPPSDVLNILPFEKIVGFAAEQLVTKFMQQPVNVEPEALPDANVEDEVKFFIDTKADKPTNLHEHKARKVKTVITIGPFDRQAADLQRNLGSDFKVINLDKNKNRSNYNADLIVIMSRFNSHSKQDQALARHKDHTVVVPAGGGLGALEKAIREYFKDK